MSEEFSSRRTYLYTDDDVDVELAKSHGARYDRSREKWYVDGMVPKELADIAISSPTQKPPPVVAPLCPKCGSYTIKIDGKKGLFFGCSKFRQTGCKGSVDFDRYVENIGLPIKSVGQVLNLQPSKQSEKVELEVHISIAKLKPELVAEINKVEQLCKNQFSSRAELEKWLNTPKVALKSKTPTDFLKTVNGCKIVAKLIKTRFD
jgi:hypothetical protein